MKKNFLKPKSLKLIFYCLYIPAFICIMIAVITSYRRGINVSYLTRDPLAITGSPLFFGFISNIGALLWCSSVAICFFSYVLLKTSKKHQDASRFIIFGGFLSLLLLIDDFFMLHEKIYKRFLGANERIVFLIYGMLILFYLVNFRKKIIETDFIFILLALFFFMLSVLIDTLPRTLVTWHHIFEDGSKFFGIVNWLGYQFSVCLQELQSVINTSIIDKNINSK